MRPPAPHHPLLLLLICEPLMFEIFEAGESLFSQLSLLGSIRGGRHATPPPPPPTAFLASFTTSASGPLLSIRKHKRGKISLDLSLTIQIFHVVIREKK